jgi:hypothetical protein
MGEIAQGTDTMGGVTTTGIDCFDDTVQHENCHAIHQSVGFTNAAFGLGITGATNVADGHWSFNIAKPPVPPIPPLPGGRVYNHYVDNNADGDFTDAGEDLDANVPGAPNSNGNDIPNGEEPATVEGQALDAEPDNEDQRAGDDWGNPGKNHKTKSHND